MVKYKHLILFVILITSSTVHAQSFVMNEQCTSAYQHFMAMKVNTAKSLLLQEVKSNPKNAMPLLLANYEDFINLVFNENPEIFRKRKPLKDTRLKALENTDKNSPYYLFAKALIYFQWSMIQIKYTNYWDAAWDFRKSHLLFKENKKKFPSFFYNDIYLGAQLTVISTIPNGYKWLSNLLGLKGNMKNGMSLLKSATTRNEAPFKEEAFLYYIYLKNYIENDVEGANKLIATNKLDIKNNQLFCFMAANLALNNKNAAATESILLNRNKSEEYIPFPMLDYELGDAKLRRLDFMAIQHYQQFIKATKSNFYLKDACLNIAYAYYLQGNAALANEYKLKIKSIGKTESDADKQAQKFAESGVFPDKDLLKARLLNDGGYNEQALKILVSRTMQSFKTQTEQLEFIYRYGRVYDDLNQDEKAVEYYKQTIALGETSTAYFAARAALQAGYIYEKKGRKQEALLYFNKALSLEDHEFKNSIDQRAKAAVNRIKGN